MSSEKRVLELAESIGIENAYFSYGTLFASPDCAPPNMLREFVKAYASAFVGSAEVTKGREEIAIDFVLPKA